MLFCLTANHRNTEFDVLDRISRVADALAGDLTQTHSFIRGAVVLATCNRFEAYLELDEPLTGGAAVAREAVLDMLHGPAGDDADALRASAVSITGTEVVHHLFAVSAGLESMVIGEEEISGQVQRALVSARESGTTSSELERAFQRAAHTNREMRATADVAAAGRSLARIALDLADTRVTDWSTVPVLLVGTGQYAATTIAALRSRGAEDIRVFSASGRAERFALKYGIRPERDLREAIRGAEIVMTCTARYTVTPSDVPDAKRRLIIDLGLPRNVDPAVADVDGVELLDLELIGRHASLPELGPSAFEIVGTAATAFHAEQAAAPAIVALRGHVQTVLDAELERVRARGGDPATEAALRHLAGVLSHGPTVRARVLAAEGRLGEFEDALETLFGVEVERPAARGWDGLAAV